MLTNGFQLISFDETMKLRAIALDSRISLEKRERCPACGGLLEAFASLMGNAGRLRIRVGMCALCGYAGYMDMPSAQWFTAFYAGQWDRARVPFTALSASHYRALALIGNGPFHKRSVLEIGCGYGAALRYFAEQGFSRVVGTEPCRHRAEYARKISGAECVEGNFEDAATQTALHAYAPYHIIFSHHVIEHTHNPEAFIANAARLQVDGDRLILALPNVVGEHIGYVLFYLPHPHSFSKQAIEQLLNRYGYAITEDASPHALNTIISAVKTKTPHPRYNKQEDYRALMDNKIKTGLALSDLSLLSTPALWHWNAHDKGAGGDDAWITARPRIRHPAFMRRIIRRFRNPMEYSFAVTPLLRRYDDSIPYEIHYTGPIRLLVK